MNILAQFLKIFVFVGGVQVGILQATPTPNPECSGMDKAARHAQQAIKTLTGKDAKCRKNSNCSGLSCHGSFLNNPLSMQLELRQCKNPIEAHVDLTNGGTSFHRDVVDGHTYAIVDNAPVIKMTLNVTLKRKGNTVMAGATLKSCTFYKACEHIELLNQNFTVIMSNCPGYSTVSPPTGSVLSSAAASSTGLVTETASTARKTTSPKTHSTAIPPTARKTTAVHSDKPKSRKTPATESTATTKLRTVTEAPRQLTTVSSKVGHITEKPITKKPNSTHTREPFHARHTGGKKNGLSSGQVAGIAVGCIMAVLVVVGVLFYYKRCYRRSRLRAAYYNDISMNDPLYDDFGPEIA